MDVGIWITLLLGVAAIVVGVTAFAQQQHRVPLIVLALLLAAAAVIVVIVAALGAAAASGQPGTSQPKATPTTADIPVSTPSDNEEPESEPSSEPTAAVVPTQPKTLYLMNLDDDAIVQDPHWVWDSEGPNAVGGVTYPNSLSYEFQNCSRCTESLEFIVPAGYTRLQGVFGLSDSSRHDDVIDGVVYFTIYDASGNQLTAPQRIEYPESVPVDVDIAGQPRIRIEMSEGTNYEQFVLGDAAIVQ